MIRWLCFLAFHFICVSILAQDEGVILKQAETAFAERRFRDASSLFNRYLAISRQPDQVYFKAAIASYESGDFERAERYLSFIRANSLASESKIEFMLGQIAQAKAEFTQAIIHYKAALRNGELENPSTCKKLILQCQSAKKINLLSSFAFVENLEKPINSVYDEIAPVLSPNFNGRLYFSSNRAESKGGRRDANGLPDDQGAYAFDMYKADQVDGLWTSPRAFNDLLNSPRHEILQDFTSEGQVAFFFQGLNTLYGEILTDTFEQGAAPKLSSPKFIAPADAVYGDRDLFFLNDSTLIFASVRDEGYGGYDLYITFYRAGIWTQPKNLGTEVNSPYHDRCPFVGRKGNLFFSSDRIDAFGGFDIYFAPWTSRGWKDVQNMRSGINSASDELYFRRGKDSYSWFFSSNRKEGEGGFDLYHAFFKEPFGGEQSGKMTDVAATFGATRIQASGSASEKGKDKWIIRPLLFEEGQEKLTPEQEQTLDLWAKRLLGYPELKLNLISFSDYDGPKKYDLYFSMKSGELCMRYLQEKGVPAHQLNVLACGSSYPISIQLDRPGNLPNFNINRRVNLLLSGQVPVEVVYDQLVGKGNWEESPFGKFWNLIEGISFSVQIAATQQLYEGAALTTYRNPLLHTQAENPILKYSLGIFERYEEARNLRYRLIKDGYKGAFITAYIDGIRRTRGELRAVLDQYPDIEAYINVE